MKNRILKKHNNTESGRQAPDYAKGVKVFEYGERQGRMTYTCAKKTDGEAVWYNKVKKYI